MPGKGFYGWYLLAAACFVYGFGITPGYYSWGVLFIGLEKELGYTRADLGLVFGLFTFLYSGVGPIVAWAQSRFSIRAVMTFGSLLAATGFVIVSQAESKAAFLIGFSIFAGCGIGLSTIIPAQTLGQNWFLKRRALAIALIMTSGGVVGLFVPALNVTVMEAYSWRTGWLVVAGFSLAAALVSVLFIRDTPEQMGQHRDGLPPGDASALSVNSGIADRWTAAMAFRTPQFWLIVVAGTAYAVPWGVIISHGASHIRDTDGIADQVKYLMGIPALASILGRFAGSLGDWLRPQVVLVASLLLEGLGCVGFLYAESVPMALVSLGAVGLGFGAAYVSIPVVFTDFFGRRAFGMTSGIRILFTGIFNGLAPYVAGRVFDATGSYAWPFWGLLGVCLLGMVATSIARNPGAPPEPAPSDAAAARSAA